MKKIIVIIVYVILFNQAESQIISIQQGKLQVRNSQSHTFSYHLVNENTEEVEQTIFALKPTEKRFFYNRLFSGTFNILLEEKVVKQYKIVRTYDILSYQADVNIVKAEYERKARRRQFWDLFMTTTETIFVGNDDTNIDEIIDLLGKGKLIHQGLTAENETELNAFYKDLADELIKDEMLRETDDRRLQRVIVLSHALKKMSEKNYYPKDYFLERFLDEAKNLLKNQDQKWENDLSDLIQREVKAGRITQYARAYTFVEFSLSNTRTVSYNGINSLMYERELQRPLSFSVGRFMKFSKTPFRDLQPLPSMGIYGKLAYTRFGLTYQTENFDSTYYPIGRASSFSSIGFVGGLKAFRFGFVSLDAGVHAVFKNDFSYKQDINTEVNLRERNRTGITYEGINFSLGGAFNYTYKDVNLFTRFDIYFGLEEKNYAPTAFVTTSLGLAIPINRNFRYFKS